MLRQSGQNGFKIFRVQKEKYAPSCLIANGGCLYRVSSFR